MPYLQATSTSERNGTDYSDYPRFYDECSIFLPLPCISFIFIFVGSTAGATVGLLAPHVGVSNLNPLPLLFTVIAVHMILFDIISGALGGAFFNPTANIANLWLGDAEESVISLGVKIPAQMGGSVLGAYAIKAIMPGSFQHTLGGPKLVPGVPVWQGAAIEGILTCGLTLFILWVILRGPKGFWFRNLSIIFAVLTFILLGAPFTGPAMNPAFAFAWAYVEGAHTTMEHFYVYWLAPTIGAILAAVLFSILFSQQKVQVESKDKKDS